MGDFAIDDKDLLHAILDGIGAGIDLRDHAAIDGAVLFEGFCLYDSQLVEEAVFILRVFHDAVDVAHEDETFGIQRCGDLGSGRVCIYVVRLSMAVDTDGGDDGDESGGECAVDHVRVDMIDLSHESQLLVFGMDLDHIAVDAAEADGFSA